MTNTRPTIAGISVRLLPAGLMLGVAALLAACGSDAPMRTTTTTTEQTTSQQAAPVAPPSTTVTTVKTTAP
jgi:ABC-type glycerol-3-phosphate transport system substrate-binding protein